MKIFVTGGAGFIGRHLVFSLLNNGYQVTIFDNFSNSSQSKIKDLTKNGAKLVKGDILEYKSVLKLVKGADFVVHLAAKINVRESIAFPEKTHDVNVTGSLNLLRACVEQKVHNIVSASSAAVYGDCRTTPIKESSTTVPISPYGASKLAMEHYIQTFSHSYNLNSISLRFFNVYGLGQSMSYAGIITKFIENITKNRTLEIFGDGYNTRDFVAIEDVVQAIQKAIKNIDGKKGHYYNIASGKKITIQNLAKLMISLSGKNLRVIHRNSRKGDVRYSEASISLAKKELGYVPKIKLKSGLEKLMVLVRQ